MAKSIVGVIIFLLILFVFYWTFGAAEHFSTPDDKPFVELYEDFDQQNPIFEFSPVLEDDYPGANYFRGIVRGTVRSISLNLPAKKDGLDSSRCIELWRMNPGSVIASLESNFYSPFTEDDAGRRGNPAKYQLITKVHAGSQLKFNLAEPTTATFVYARF